MARVGQRRALGEYCRAQMPRAAARGMYCLRDGADRVAERGKLACAGAQILRASLAAQGRERRPNVKHDRAGHLQLPGDPTDGIICMG